MAPRIMKRNMRNTERKMIMMRRKGVFRVLTVLALTVCTSFAGELDLLVQELVARGVIDAGRAQEILTLTEEEMRKELVKGTVPTLPDWVQTLGLRGDFRFRNQWEEAEHDSLARLRQRVRFRLSGEANVSKGFKVGFGLATGGNDPRSTNQTLDNSFETKTIMLDYAYGEYEVHQNVKILFGKFYNNVGIWLPTDYMWDTDITLEGIAGLLKFRQLFLNAGVYFLDEKGKVKDVIRDNPRMVVFQPGFSLGQEGVYSIRSSVTYYHFNQTKGMAFDHAKWSNSFYSVGTDKYLANGFNNLVLATEAGLYDKFLPYIGIFGEYNINLEAQADTANSGMTAGIVLGTEKIKAPGQWQVRYQYRRLAKDAWLDFLPDADTYSGKTDVRGNEVSFLYGWAKNVILGIDYYKIENLQGKIVPETIWQFDINFKF